MELTTVGFEPAPDFPTTPYETVHSRLAHLADSAQADTWRQFAGAWNAVAYRFQACVECDEAFRADFARLGTNAGGLDRYRQQRDTYGCVVNGCSVVEASYYAAHAIGALIDPLAFPMVTAEDLRAVNPSTTVDRHRATFPGDPIADALAAVLAAPEWASLKDLRNILVHRAGWAKHVVRSAGETREEPVDLLRLSDHYVANMELGPSVTHEPRKGVGRALATLCLAIDAFATRTFP